MSEHVWAFDAGLSQRAAETVVEAGLAIESAAHRWGTAIGRRAVPSTPTRGPERGVFATRSPDRPNPIGLHRVTVLAIDGLRMRVRHLEALDGTPVLDVKPLLKTVEER